MVRIEDIHSLTDFQRNARSYIGNITKTKAPIALTVNGEPQVVVQDAHAYQAMVDELDKARLVTMLLEGEADIAKGRVHSIDSVFQKLRGEDAV